MNKMSGAVGFEPMNAGSKNRGLGERLIKNVGIAWFFLELYGEEVSIINGSP